MNNFIKNINKMSKGLYFYKLVSPYKEDVTKDCKLTINEIDSNFITLKDADVKEVSFDKETKKIQLIKNNGDILETDLSSLDKNFDVDYDRDNGIMTITYGDRTFIVNGLVTNETLRMYTLTHVNSDGSLSGLGTNKKPLGLKEVEKTGQPKPCKRFLDLTKHEHLPKCEHLKKGDRYLVKECISDYGYLYDFKSVKLIGKNLICGWRIPSKADWDDMLNAIEECDSYRTHGLTIANKELGKIAGKLLKTCYEWDNEVIYHKTCECDNISKNDEFDVDDEVDTKHYNAHNCKCVEQEYYHNGHFEHEHKCGHNNCGQDKCENEERHHPHMKPVCPIGVDAYNMSILPAGYGDGCEVMEYFGKRTGFWTSTMIDNTDVYVKRFDYNKAGVVQTAESPRALFSLRLVKDYDGSNFNNIEYINGQPYTCVLMPSTTSKTGYAIWTSRNIAFSDDMYNHKQPSSEGFERGMHTEYFTSEWDGHKWLKKIFSEGDSVVLFNGPDDKFYDEYRLIHRELVNTTSKLHGEIIDEIGKEIDRLDHRIDEEIDERIAADEALSGAIETEISRAISAETQLREDLDAEIERAIAMDEALSGAIETEISRAISAETQLREDLDAEIERAIAMDEALSGAIETEIAERIKEDEILHETLSAETAARIEKDEYLEGRLINSGSTYNSVNGELTLTTDNPDNTFTIQFNGNYGTL